MAAVDRLTLTAAAISDILDEARRLNGNGAMFLHGYGIGPTPEKISIAEWPPETAIIRTPEGGALSIPCNNNRKQDNTPVSHVRIPPAYTHNGVLVLLANDTTTRKAFKEMSDCCACTMEREPEDYTAWHTVQASGYDPVTGAFILTLEGFSNAHSGLYECLHSNGSQLVMTQRYWVSATLKRHEVFSPPMQNVTVRYGEPAKMECPVRFKFLPGDLVTRFLWRKGRYVANMPPGTPPVIYTDASQPDFDGVVRFSFGINAQNQCLSAMMIPRVKWTDAGWYECWFRINDRLDE
ncbi:uncharacterized protein LOC129588980 [Paramacrobiotus metropolitanus]|uniref:uncharacterized protein LOC129588980 n=1 Tax=Paramacrobiotus metropolitanus TaxID=2943436 RepID=UPI0024458295|nr:uncharacterized protein LOC129588980 [Paramacrobiotus metropolitanus]